ATSSSEQYGGRRYLPYVYTEQGIGMLSGLLKNDTAVDVSIGIMNAFVEMRKLLAANADIFAKLAQIDIKLLEHDHKLDEVFSLLAQPEIIKQNIFYKGQFYDAHQLVRDIINQAKSRIIVIDNYADTSVLDLLAAKAKDVAVTIITDTTARIPNAAISKFEKQYGSIKILTSKDFHDRFVVIDNKVYTFGASLKDLGNKCFGVFKNEDVARFLAYVERLLL
ncbi:MAG: ORF6N domain-containing protein, partial [Coriobacteriaceae bacterium]|nr:ORF6N domain-containing protein [Coriobacteriaceae bacterium]